MLKKIEEYLRTLPEVRTDRRTVLEAVAEAHNQNTDSTLVFVCTHNSRRSQLCEVWGRVFASMAHKAVRIQSAGTEETAFNIRTINALRRCGMEIESCSDMDRNPHYLLRYAINRSRLDCWSKTLDDPSIDFNDAVVIMTCGHADAHCPNIPEAASRISLTYTDPKGMDDTAGEVTAYDDCCRQVTAEMHYLIDRLH